MQEKHARSLTWFCSLVVFFPAWIVCQRLFVRAVRGSGLDLPDWLYGLCTFLIFAILLMFTAYRAAAFINRLFPDSPPRSADWADQ